jgi:hypothetical protein
MHYLIAVLLIIIGVMGAICGFAQDLDNSSRAHPHSGWFTGGGIILALLGFGWLVCLIVRALAAAV